MTMRFIYPLICALFLFSMFPLDFVVADPNDNGESESFTLYGNLYDAEGNPAAVSYTHLTLPTKA